MSTPPQIFESDGIRFKTQFVDLTRSSLVFLDANDIEIEPPGDTEIAVELFNVDARGNFVKYAHPVAAHRRKTPGGVSIFLLSHDAPFTVFQQGVVVVECRPHVQFQIV